MAKPPSSAIGIDIGRHSIKAVLLARRGSNRVAVTHFAVRPLAQEGRTVEVLAAGLKGLLQDLGATCKVGGIAISTADSMVRIIDQPAMPPALLRDALRLNGVSLLNQDCKDLVLDCDLIPSSEPAQEGAPNPNKTVRYVVGGLPRVRVQEIHEASVKSKTPTSRLQVTPISVFNAFEFSNEETFNNQAFVLVDIGHVSTTVIVGVKKELILVRALEFGGHSFVEELICHGASGYEEIMSQLEQEEVLTVENARLSLTELVRSISSSIGFFEARREEAIPRVFVCGGMAKSPMILKILTEELQLPCESWDPFAKCEISVSSKNKELLLKEGPVLSAACGVAAEILKG